MTKKTISIALVLVLVLAVCATAYAIELEDVTYTVVFRDFDDSVLKEETVIEGDDATAPADPERESYLFVGWDTDFTNVTENLEVAALYQRLAQFSFIGFDNLTGSWDQYPIQWYEENNDLFGPLVPGEEVSFELTVENAFQETMPLNPLQMYLIGWWEVDPPPGPPSPLGADALETFTVSVAGETFDLLAGVSPQNEFSWEADAPNEIAGEGTLTYEFTIETKEVTVGYVHITASMDTEVALPDAAKITAVVDESEDPNLLTVTGEAGAVEPYAQVSVYWINESYGQVGHMPVQADEYGGFVFLDGEMMMDYWGDEGEFEHEAGRTYWVTQTLFNTESGFSEGITAASAPEETPIEDPADPEEPEDPEEPVELPETGGYHHTGFSLLLILGGAFLRNKRA